MRLKKYKFSSKKAASDSVYNEGLSGTYSSTSDLVFAYQQQWDDENCIEQICVDGDGPVSNKSARSDIKARGDSVGYMKMLSLAGMTEYALMAAGLFGAVINGCSFPMLMVIFGQLADVFINDERQKYNNMTQLTTASTFTTEAMTEEDESLLRRASTYTIIFSTFGVVVFIGAFLQVFGWQESAARQTRRLRTDLFKKLLYQSTDWLDQYTTGDHITKLTNDIDSLEGGIGDKMAMLVQHAACMLCSLVIGLVYGWKLTLVMLAISPLIVASGFIISKVQVSMGKKQISAYGAAGGVAQEAVSAIKTVMAYGGQQYEVQRYTEKLQEARKAALKKGLVTGVAIGAISFNIGACYCLGWWYGAQLLTSNTGYTPGRVLSVFLSILLGLLSSRSLYTDIDNVTNAKAAAAGIFSILDMDPEHSHEDSLIKDVTLLGTVDMKDITFSYPSRPEIKVLDNVCITVPPGKTVAVVGASGSGKSTLVSLLQKLYTPQRGAIKIDGSSLSDYNTKWLRRQLATVSQDPVLFSCSIADNIRLGKQDATEEEISEAAQWANIHNDIMKMPQGYDTVVGEQGCQLSGGQRQRVALARALITKPSLLMLDEATSALDSQCEKQVHEAIMKARHGQSTLLIAHRLSTVRDADVIYCMERGQVVEKGSHKQLMEKKGLYHRLYSQQDVKNKSQKEIKDMVEISSVKDTEKVSAIKENGIQHMNNQQKDDEISHLRESFRKVKRKVSSVLKKKIAPVEKPKKEKISTRLFKLNSPEWIYIALGGLCALISGAVGPVFALLIGEVIGVLVRLDSSSTTDVTYYAIAFLGVGLFDCLVAICMTVSLAKAGAELTSRLRHKTFAAIMSQDMTFFDNERNSAGALGMQLASDTSAVLGVTGAPVGRLCSSVASLGAGFIIGLVYSWKLTFVLLIFVPLLLLAGYSMIKLMQRDPRTTKGASDYLTASKMATEALDNHRTVKAFCVEEKLIKDYTVYIDKLYGKHTVSSLSYGLGLGLARSLIFFIHSVGYTFGAYLIQTGQLTFMDMYKVFRAIVFGALSTGQGYSFAPNIARARQAGSRLFSIIDREPRVRSPENPQKLSDKFKGAITMNDVKFSYPARKDCAVLNGTTLTVPAGQTVALVGGSGAGKSTVMALIQRLYDASHGNVEIDGMSIDKLDVDMLRSHMGLVSQDPVLFNRTIRENICYGELTRHQSMQDVIGAARKANIHAFISSLPDGYETVVGVRGVQLSGGQKQRVAIARALIREPAILLLDEPTAALDANNEKIVQEALEKAQTGRTSVVIAHRLSTVKNADVILVLDGGEVVESGSHEELLEKKGAYYSLYFSQVSDAKGAQ